MAKAYDHMPAFQRVRNFASQRIHELREQLDGAKSEVKMWQEPEVEALLGRAGLDVQSYLSRQLHAANARITALMGELKKWERFYDSMIVCNACNGYGEIRAIVSPDASYYDKCAACGGTGTPEKRAYT